MWTQSYLNYMLSDEVSLHSYYVEMSPVTLKDIKRSLMLIVRESNISIPDPHYRLGQERSFDNIDLFSKLFTIGLSAIGERHLEIRNRKIFVKAERQLDWQMLLPYMPPLVVVSIKIWNEFPNITFNRHEIIEYISQYITPNVRFTCLPCPFIPQMEELKKSNKGFNDLHIHLNGALETDYTWQDLLSYPDKVYVEMNDAMKNEKVKEHFLQLSPFLTPSSFRRLLRIARNLRMILFQSIMPNLNSEREEINSLLKLLSMKNSMELPTHPMELLMEEPINPVSEEAMFYILIFDYLSKNPNDEYVAQLFYYYLLILGQANKLLVQQRDCFGFEEFQKYTLNGVREFSEKTYRRRFLQLSGNELDNIRILEGRFSPKDTITKNEELIENIILGWKELEKRYKDETNSYLPELRLIAHFIKKPDSKHDDFIRHKLLRNEINNKADILAQLRHMNHSYAKKIKGIDAAASEFDAPPEVFAQAYRKLRNKGYNHFTFHAGEDFYHVLSGLRAIYEAIDFLDLRRCDRIGHATAAGISCDLWRNNLGDKLLIRKGEYLDDLVFTYHLISQFPHHKLMSFLPQLNIRINTLCFEVYNEYIPLPLLVQSWLHRWEDPEEIISKYLENQEKGTHVDAWLKFFIKYHEKECVERYNEVIEVETYDIFGYEELTELQLILLEIMHDREIVIETLPTSNVIIGVHRAYDTYHLFNWKKWSQEGHPIPPIVVGTDDTGIFATNIYNEYCNIFCQFMYKKKMNANEIVRYLKELHYNSQLYSFN